MSSVCWEILVSISLRWFGIEATEGATNFAKSTIKFLNEVSFSIILFESFKRDKNSVFCDSCVFKVVFVILLFSICVLL